MTQSISNFYASLGDRDAVVTGASGDIGQAAAVALAAESQWRHVFAVCSSESEELQALEQRHDKLIVLKVSRKAGEQAFAVAVAEALREHKAAPALLINAIGLLHNGELQPERKLSELDADSMLALYRSNAVAPMLLCQQVCELMPRREPALLVNFSARVGSIGDNKLGGWYSYRASKAAVNMLSQCLAVELGRSHKSLSVICYHPGTVDTGLSKPFQRNVPDGKLFDAEFAAERLLEVLHGLDNQAGLARFLDWQGEAVQW